MNRREFLKSVGVGVVAVGIAPSSSDSKDKGSQPNIILIMADDISAKDFPTYRTPNPTYGVR